MIFVIIAAACMLVRLMLSGIESILLKTNRERLYHCAKFGDAAAIALRSLLAQRDCLLVTVLTFSTIFRILTLALLYCLLEPKIGVLGVAVTVTPIIPLLELPLLMLPQALFQRLPISVMILLTGILAFFQKRMKPLASFLLWLSRPLMVHDKRGSLSSQITTATTTEIGLAVSQLAQTGQLSHTAAQLIQNFLKFRNQSVSSFVLPLREIVHVRPDTSIYELFALSRQTACTEQMLVLGEHKHIVGVIDIFDLLLDGIRIGRAKSHTRKVISVTSTETLCTAVRKMRAAKSRICAVTEKVSGHILGVVTVDSLLQYLFIGKSTLSFLKR